MIQDLKDLQKLFKLCRAQGISAFKMGTIEIKFGDVPMTEGALQEIAQDTINQYSNFPQGNLTPEQLMFYSAGGLPENDPENKEAV